MQSEVEAEERRGTESQRAPCAGKGVPAWLPNLARALMGLKQNFKKYIV